ncbi:MAG TPA: glycosyltransferase, partial [Planctomycetaceae bacterium]
MSAFSPVIRPDADGGRAGRGDCAAGAPARPLGIAYVVHTFHAGGLERCAAYLANQLDRSAFRPVIVCLNRSGAAAEWVTAADVPIVELRKWAGNDPRAATRLARVLKEYRIDLAQSHNWGTLIETSIACRLSGAVHVHAEHGQELNAMPAGRTRRWLRRAARQWAFGRCAATVACAESVRRHLHRAWGFPPCRVEFIPNGIVAPTADGAARSRVRRELAVPDDAVVLGSVGRLAAVKDFGTAIRAVAELRDRTRGDGEAPFLVLVGDGPEREALERVAAAVGASDRVRFAGRRSDVGDCLAAFDLYVNSSLGEAMSLSILEAMACGLPVVATDVGDTAEMLGGRAACGVTVPAGDASALAAAIDALIREPERRSVLGR